MSRNTSFPKLFCKKVLPSYLPTCIIGYKNSKEHTTMMISTKGRYALRVMIDIAEHQHDGYIPLKEIAARQENFRKSIWRPS